MKERKREEVSKRVIVTTKREVWLKCYDDDDVSDVVSEAFDELGDYDELIVEETDDDVCFSDIDYAKQGGRYAEWLDD